MARLIARAREEEIEVIFTQPEFSAKAAETIASEIGGEVLFISPLAEDWLDSMRRGARVFAQRLGSWPRAICFETATKEAACVRSPILLGRTEVTGTWAEA